MSTHKSTVTRYKDYPQALCSLATAGKSDPLKQPTYPIFPSPQSSSPIQDTARDSPMDSAESEAQQAKEPVPDQVTTRDQQPAGASMKKPEPACGVNYKYLCERCDGPSYSLGGHGQGKGRYLSHEYEENLDWRYQVMKAHFTAKSKHQECRYANSFFKHGTPPCDMGWGKALNEYMWYNGQQSMETATPKAILAKYHERHVHEQRQQSPQLILVETGTPDQRMWELYPTKQQQQSGQREQGEPSASSCPYRRS